MAGAAAGLVTLAAADEDHRFVIAGRFTVDQALGAGGGGAAADTDGVQLVDLFSQGHQQRHRPEGFAAEILIQPGGDDLYAAVGKVPGKHG